MNSSLNALSGPNLFPAVTALHRAATRSSDDEKPVSGCNRVTSGCDGVSVVDELIARYAAQTIGVIGLIFANGAPYYFPPCLQAYREQ